MLLLTGDLGMFYFIKPVPTETKPQCVSCVYVNEVLVDVRSFPTKKGFI